MINIPRFKELYNNVIRHGQRENIIRAEKVNIFNSLNLKNAGMEEEASKKGLES